MIFWDRFYQLCITKGTKPNPVAKEINIGSGTLTKWKEGHTSPNSEALIKIAKYFNCSTDYLLGLTDLVDSLKSEFSQEDISILNKINKLNIDDRTEVMMIIDFRLNRQEKRKSSPSGSTTADDVHDMLA